MVHVTFVINVTTIRLVSFTTFFVYLGWVVVYRQALQLTPSGLHKYKSSKTLPQDRLYSGISGASSKTMLFLMKPAGRYQSP